MRKQPEGHVRKEPRVLRKRARYLLPSGGEPGNSHQRRIACRKLIRQATLSLPKETN